MLSFGAQLMLSFVAQIRTSPGPAYFQLYSAQLWTSIGSADFQLWINLGPANAQILSLTTPVTDRKSVV